MNCFGACGLYALPRVVFHDFGRTSWWWYFNCPSVRVIRVLLVTSLNWLLLVLTNDLQSTDMKDWQWSDQWFPPVAVPARESVREMAQNRIHVTKCKTPPYSVQHVVTCSNDYIVVTVAGNCLFVMTATLAPSSVQSDPDKATTCL